MSNPNYEIRWYIPNQVALLVQHNDMSIEEIVKMLEETNQLIATSPLPKVSVIVDGSKMSTTKANIGQVVKEFRAARSDKWGFTVVVGAKGIIQFVAQLILQLARVEVRLAKDMDEALDMLYRMYPDLPSVK